jgi:microbial collagenase
VIGLAPRCTAAVASALQPTLPDAFPAAVGFLQAGDVLLIEVQGAANRPVEMDPHVAMLIRALTLAGIVVIEPAGNGMTDLDTIVRADGTGFQRGAFNFVDSGAVMVGARQAAVRARASFSNFGSRIDTHAFGEGVVTTSAAPGQPYRGILGAALPGMGGTSGASALIAGAAVVLQGIARARGTTITPNRMRTLLSDPSFNTPTDNPSSDRIGPMPNLDAAAEHI